jgi:hypothetical protein
MSERCIRLIENVRTVEVLVRMCSSHMIGTDCYLDLFKACFIPLQARSVGCSARSLVAVTLQLSRSDLEAHLYVAVY